MPAPVDVLLASADPPSIESVLAAFPEGPSDGVSLYSVAEPQDPRVAQVRYGVPAISWPDYAGTCVRLAAATCDRLEDLSSGFLSSAIPGINLRPLAGSAIARRLAFREVPGILAFLGFRREAPPRSVPWSPVVCTHGYSIAPDHLLDLDRAHDGPSTITEAFAVPGNGARLVTKIHKYFRRGQPGTSEEVAARVRDAGPFEAVVVVGAETDLVFLRPLVQLVSGAARVLVLQKNDLAGTARAAGVLMQDGAAAIVRGDEFSTIQGAAPTRVSLTVALTPLFESQEELAPGDAAFAGLHLGSLNPLLRSLLASEALLAAARPRFVAGAFDSGLLGPMIRLVSAATGTEVWNFQHGTVSRLGAALAGSFDLSMVWNEHSRDAFVGAGAPADSVGVLGNPRWEELAGPAEGRGRSAGAGALRRWRGDRPLIVAFPQPDKAPFLAPGNMGSFFGWCADALDATTRPALLVKRRAVADFAGEEVLSRFDDDRVRFMDDDEIALGEALAEADLAVSVMSTALADSVAAGVAGAAFDVGGSFEALGSDFASSVSVCRSVDDVRALFTRLDDGKPLDGPGADRRFVPVFEQPYRDRLAAVLRERGFAIR